MIRRRLKSLSSSRLELLLLLFCACASAGASELSLREFTASYDLHKGDRHVANTELRLQRDGEFWHFSSLTKARGIYKWFVHKQPLVYTSFGSHAEDYRLREIQIGDARKKKFSENALFDWEQRRMDSVRKGKHRQAKLEGSVYDYHSIHLLAASLNIRGSNEATVDFYRKGKLVESRMVLLGQEKIDIDGKSMNAILFQQEITGSGSQVRYYYDATNPLLPLRIETLEKDEKPAVLTLRRVDWDL